MSRKTKSKSSVRARHGSQVTRNANRGANFTGAGSGAVLLWALKSVPDDRPWKQFLLYFAPALALAVRRGAFWLAVVFGEYVHRKWADLLGMWDYKRTMAQLDKEQEELRRFLLSPHLSEENREEIMKALDNIDKRRIAAVHILRGHPNPAI